MAYSQKVFDNTKSSQKAHMLQHFLHKLHLLDFRKLKRFKNIKITFPEDFKELNKNSDVAIILQFL